MNSFNEFIERTQRCCIINKKQLLNSLCLEDDFSRFQQWYLATLEEKLDNLERTRQAFWSQATVVGDREWLYGEARAMGMKKIIVSQGNSEQYYLGKC
ncbi:MAG: hypothetical protein PHT71_07730 [Victivallaceae bacterium]|nr:hypothetical protein [Victivallaceae bacterium]